LMEDATFLWYFCVPGRRNMSGYVQMQELPGMISIFREFRFWVDLYDEKDTLEYYEETRVPQLKGPHEL
jgi:hypothetical protein